MADYFHNQQNQGFLHRRRQNWAESFSCWEQVGRGWQLFDYEIELEPSFSRFISPLNINSSTDDGRVPGLFRRLFPNRQNEHQLLTGQESFADQSNGQSARIQSSLATSIKPAFFRLYLPKELKISLEQNEQISNILASSTSWFSFEIIGSREEIIFQIACPETQKSAVVSQLKNYLPTVDIRETEDALNFHFSTRGTEENLAVDFGLSKEWFIPLPFSKGFATDTLLPLMAAMEELEEGDFVCLQVLFSCTRGNWQAAVQEAIFDRNGKFIFANLNNCLSGIKDKLSNPLLAVAVRLLVESDSGERSLQIIRHTKAFFQQFSSPFGNELIPLKSEGLSQENHLQSIFKRTTYRTGMLLSQKELSALIHLPSDTVKSAKLKREQNLTKPAPHFITNNTTDGNLILGENIHAGVTSKIPLSSVQRIKHSHYIGASGSGKSTLLTQNMIQDLELDNGFACFDPHGDLIDSVLERVPESRIKDVILFDPSDEEYPIGFNILSAHSELEKTLLASDLVSIFRRFSTSWGDVMNSILANAVLAFLESSRGGSLIDLKRFLLEKHFREEFLKTVSDEEIRYYWLREFPELKGKPFAPLLTRLDTFLRSKLIRYIIAQKENKLDFRRIMDERKILLVRLSLGAIGEENAYLLGSLLVAKLYHATLSRQNVAEDARPPFFLYLDEAHHFVTESMNQILSGVRKYKLGLILAHQQLRQFQAGEVDILTSVLANCYTRICFRLDDADAERLAKGFSFFTADHFKNLGVGEAIARFEQSQYDFNLRTFPLEPVPSSLATQRRIAIIEQTRKNYAKAKTEIEAERKVQSEKRQGNGFAFSPLQEKSKANNQVNEFVLPLPVPTQSNETSTTQEPVVTVVTEVTTPNLAISPIITKSQKDKSNNQHRYLQSLVKKMAENKGFLVHLEKEVFGGAGKIDAVLEREEEKLAVEISVTNDPNYELQNIQKCLSAGFSQVIVISADRRHLEKIKQKAEGELPENEFNLLLFLSPEEFHLWLESLSQNTDEKNTKIKGFKVKVKLNPVEEKSRSSRQKAINEIVFGGLKKIKKNDSEE